MLLQVDRIIQHVDKDDWDGLEIVGDLPGRGRGVKVTRPFMACEVVCHYGGRLLSHKEGKEKYAATPEHSMGFLFEFKHKGKSLWRDATEELPGAGRLINHSRCHGNVSMSVMDSILIRTHKLLDTVDVIGHDLASICSSSSACTYRLRKYECICTKR